MKYRPQWQLGAGSLLLALVCGLVGLMVAQSAWAEETPAPVQEQLETPSDAAAATAIPSHQDPEWMVRLNEWVGKWCVEPLSKFLFFDFWTKRWLGTSVPFVVAWLAGGALFLTVRMGFINLRAFRHAVRVTRGDYDDPSDAGEVTHFQALSSALSATVGLGNIAGVAIAVGKGGPGAVFWMIISGLLGMTSKFTECALAVKYRQIDHDGRVLGGPMRYLKDGLAEKGWGPLGAVLAFFFTMFCIGASFGGGCTFQVVQSMGIVQEHLPIFKTYPWLYGIAMVVLVGVVIVGGIRRIAATAEKLVPTMCAIYVLASLVVLIKNYDQIGWAFGVIFREAFTFEATYGGVLGVMVVGIRRASFSNEAGVGSAAIAHSAARTDEPIREGIVALLEPFIDTVVICTMTGLVMVITHAYDTAVYPAHKIFIEKDLGSQLTSVAFGSVVPWFSEVLAVAVFLFAYSTMISWSYYGERCFTDLLGTRASMPYRILFLVFVFLGSVVTATHILTLSDLMLLSMAFPNMLGLFLLSGKVKQDLDKYWASYRAGKFPTFR